MPSAGEMRGRRRRRDDALAALRRAGGEARAATCTELCGTVASLYVDVAGETIHRRVLDALVRDGLARKVRTGAGHVVWRLR